MGRKSSVKPDPIDPVKVCTLALKQVKCASDYHRVETVNSPEILTAAWEHLTADEQQRITDIVNANTPADPQTIADELMACGNKIDLQTIKSQHGDVAVKSAWKLLPQSERDRIKHLCAETQPEPRGLTIAQAYPENVAKADAWRKQQGLVESQLANSTIVESPPSQPTKKPTLIELSAELKQIDSLLDSIDGDIPVDLQTAVDELLAQREATHEAMLEKLDNYCSLIQSRLMWVAARKAEADRLAKLAETDIKTVDFLKGRLKAYLEATDQKKLRTKRFNIAICANGGKPPIRFDSTLPEQMPERFVRVTVEPDKEAIRTALEQGEDLKFAFFAERETHLRIK